MKETIPFTSASKVSNNKKTSKNSVEALKKTSSGNDNGSKQSHVEKPVINKTLEISEKRNEENNLLAARNCDGGHQPPPSKQKQFTSLDKYLLLIHVLNTLWELLFQKLLRNMEKSFMSMIRVNAK